MPVLPITLEQDIQSRAHKIIRSGDEVNSCGGKHPLPDHNARLDYKFDYQEYHRMGDVKYGIEVTFELFETDELVENDISAIEMELTRLLQAELSFDGTVDFEKEPERYVFIEEVMHAFGERA